MICTCAYCPWAVRTGTYCQGVGIRICAEPENHCFFMIGCLCGYSKLKSTNCWASFTIMDPGSLYGLMNFWHCSTLYNLNIIKLATFRLIIQLHKLICDISYNGIWHLWSKKKNQPCYVVTSLDVSPVNNPPQICLYHVCSKVLLNISDDISCLFVWLFYGELLQ